jgi:hypothetical protein
MNSMKCRQTTRFQLGVPFCLRLPESPATPERWEETSNISGTGLYFVTDLALRVGTLADVNLRMPEIVAGKQSREWFCRGKVVRVKPGKLPGAKAGIGVEFQYYEVPPSGTSNLVSEPLGAKAHR